jgi:hypothetical protein
LGKGIEGDLATTKTVKQDRSPDHPDLESVVEVAYFTNQSAVVNVKRDGERGSTFYI